MSASPRADGAGHRVQGSANFFPALALVEASGAGVGATLAGGSAATLYAVTSTIADQHKAWVRLAKIRVRRGPNMERA